MSRFFSFSIILFLFLVTTIGNAQSITKNRNGMYGVLKGKKILIPCKYDSIITYSSIFLVKQNAIGWSLLTAKGKSIASIVFDDFILANNNLFAFRQATKWGIMSIEGKIIYKPIYKSIWWNENENKWEATSYPTYWLVKNEDTISQLTVDSLVALNHITYKYQLNVKWGITNSNGKMITSNLFEFIQPFENDLFIFSQYGKKGLIDTLGEIKVKANYDTFFTEKNTNQIIAIRSDSSNKEWHLLDQNGTQLTKTFYDRISKTSIKNYWRVYKNKKCGLIDSTGKEIVSPIYEWIDKIENEKYILKENGYSGMADKNLDWIIPPLADSIIYFPTKTILFLTKYQSHLVDLNGMELFCMNGKFINAKNNFIQYKYKNKIGLFDSKGMELALPLYDSISFSRMHDHVFWLFEKKIKTIIDENCNTIFKPDSSIQEIYFYNPDFIGVKIKGKWGFVDSRGRIRIANQYEGIQPFADDMAAVKLRGKWGFVNRAERLKVQPYYEKVFEFKEDAAMVYKEGKYGFVNKNGDEVTPIKYDSILYDSHHHLYISFLNSRKGIINRRGSESIYAKYDEVIPISDDKIIIEKDTQWGVVSIKDLLLIPFMYDFIGYNFYSNTFILKENGRKTKIQ